MSQLSFLSHFFASKWSDANGSKHRIEKAQAKRLHRLIEHSKKNVSYQSERIGNLSSREFSKIAPISKEEMLDNFDRTVDSRQLSKMNIEPKVLTDIARRPKLFPRWYNNKFLITATSGTTGETGVILNSAKTWAAQRAVVFARTCRSAIPLTRFNPLRPYRMAFAIYVNQWSVGYQAMADSAAAGSLFTNIECFPIDQPMEDLVANISKFDPQYLQSYSTILESLAKRQIESNEKLLNPQVISSFGDLLDESQQKVLKQAFPDSKIVNHYGATECTPIANTCQFNNLHVNSDYVILEPVDDNDNLVQPGEFSSHVLVTNLLNDFQPYIRYRLSDTVRFFEEDCECGSPFPRIEIKGRSYPKLVITDNQNRPSAIDGATLGTASQSHKDVARFLIKYHELNQFKIEVILESSCEPDTTAERAIRLRDWEATMSNIAKNANCDQSTRFEIEIKSERDTQPKLFKRKLFDVSAELRA